MTDDPNTPDNDAPETPDDTPSITADQLADALDLSDLDLAFGLFDQVLALIEKAPGSTPEITGAVRLFYAGAARVLQHFDERIGDLIESNRDTQALLFASAPNKVVQDLKDRYTAERHGAAVEGQDPDEVLSPEDQFEIAMNRVARLAPELGLDDEETDPDAPPA